MSLIAAELERAGIATVVLQLLREVAEKMRPPRALFVPFPHGYPLDKPRDAIRQRAVIAAALEILEERDASPPILRDYAPGEGLPRR